MKGTRWIVFALVIAGCTHVRAPRAPIIGAGDERRELSAKVPEALEAWVRSDPSFRAMSDADFAAWFERQELLLDATDLTAGQISQLRERLNILRRRGVPPPIQDQNARGGTPPRRDAPGTQIDRSSRTQS